MLSQPGRLACDIRRTVDRRTFKAFKAFACKPPRSLARRSNDCCEWSGTAPSTIRTSCNGNPSAGLAGKCRRAIDSRTGRSLVTIAGDETSATRMGGAVARRREVTATPRCAVEA